MIHHNMWIVLVWIGIGIGILIAIILIVKAAKTSSWEALMVDNYCRKCGLKTNGLKCSLCEKRTQSFGV